MPHQSIEFEANSWFGKRRVSCIKFSLADKCKNHRQAVSENTRKSSEPQSNRILIWILSGEALTKAPMRCARPKNELKFRPRILLKNFYLSICHVFALVYKIYCRWMGTRGVCKYAKAKCQSQPFRRPFCLVFFSLFWPVLPPWPLFWVERKVFILSCALTGSKAASEATQVQAGQRSQGEWGWAGRTENGKWKMDGQRQGGRAMANVKL